MQITLEVSGSQLDAEVKSLLETITPEQKSVLATQLLQKSLDNTNSELMRKAAIDKVTKEWNEGKHYTSDKVTYKDGRWCRADNPEYTASYSDQDELNRRLKRHTEAGDYFRDKVMAAMLETGRAAVTSLVENDPVVKEAVKQAVDGIKDMMPKIVHDAMVVYFCSQLNGMSHSLASSMFQAGDNNKLLTELKDRLDRNGVY